MITILIVKTSALGDIIQTFPVLSYLKQKYPEASIDWVCEESCHSLVSTHPLIRKAIGFAGQKWKKHIFASIKEIKQFVTQIRETKYDLVVDFQGNCKSSLITGLTRSKKKVGFGKNSVKEWPNLIVTHQKYEVDKSQNIRLQYLSILKQHFKDKEPLSSVEIPQRQGKGLLVCFGSNWENKRLSLCTLTGFLQKIENSFSLPIILAWGSAKEKKECHQIAKNLSNVEILEKLPFEMLRLQMQKMELVIGVDSSLLHLAAEEGVPTFSIFGPTYKHVFGPMGSQHGGYQGMCPYHVSFIKQCPKLRYCKTGRCMKDISIESLFKVFKSWYIQLSRIQIPV
jgi:heptosyltransferase I